MEIRTKSCSLSDNTNKFDLNFTVKTPFLKNKSKQRVAHKQSESVRWREILAEVQDSTKGHSLKLVPDFVLQNVNKISSKLISQDYPGSVFCHFLPIGKPKASYCPKYYCMFS